MASLLLFDEPLAKFQHLDMEDGAILNARRFSMKINVNEQIHLPRSCRLTRPLASNI
jgi:hypothetical protein